MNIEVSFSGGKKVNAKFKNFTIKTDQPICDGGEGAAPEPFSLFIASIGTCIGFYVLSFCQKRNIPTEGIKLFLKTVKYKEIHLISKIEIEIKLPKGFPDQYKKAVIRAAEQCTVKKHLDNPPKIEIFTTQY